MNRPFYTCFNRSASEAAHLCAYYLRSVLPGKSRHASQVRLTADLHVRFLSVELRKTHVVQAHAWAQSHPSRTLALVHGRGRLAGEVAEEVLDIVRRWRNKFPATLLPSHQSDLIHRSFIDFQ